MTARTATAAGPTGGRDLLGGLSAPSGDDPTRSDGPGEAQPAPLVLPPGYIEKAHRGKRSYDKKKVARQHARMTSARFGGEPKMAYRCLVCGLFHVGRDPR